MKVAIIGYGKMGHAIEQKLMERGHSIVARFNSEGIDPKLLLEADVAIEFSHPKAALTNISTCLNTLVPVVSGTTGWLKDYDEVVALCKLKSTGFLYASNFSLGVNILFEINQRLARIMNDHPSYQVSLEEIHHTQKLDAPSGTAISLAEQVIANMDRKSKWVLGPIDDEQAVAIAAKRVDEVPGTHYVRYESEIDRLEISHHAHNRDGFALGAVLAAEFLQNKQGVYTMKDVLKF